MTHTDIAVSVRNPTHAAVVVDDDETTSHVRTTA